MGQVSMKAECPACKSYLSAVYEAMHGERDAACPNCGLPGSVMREIEQARKAHADADLTVKLEAALIEKGRVLAWLQELYMRTAPLRRMFAEWERDEPVSGGDWQPWEAWPE